MAQFRCLVVEDSPMMRQLIVFALHRLRELEVVEADDGVDAMRKLAGGKFDIVVTDINMPIMDGLKLVKRIRTDEAHKNVPIIIITTEGSQEDRSRARCGTWPLPTFARASCPTVRRESAGRPKAELYSSLSARSRSALPPSVVMTTIGVALCVGSVRTR